MNYQLIMEEVASEVAPLKGKGKIADYIHQLAMVDPDKFGFALNFLDGASFNVGDTDERFSIQSISKVFMLTLAMANVGDDIWKRIDVEPSGNAFNSLIQLEYEKGIPRNPFINSGAIVVTDILLSCLTNPQEELIQLIRNISGSPTIDYNPYVAASEKATGYRNIAMANLMKDFNNIENKLDDVLDLYFQFCSIEMTCKELAQSFLLYANHGKNPLTNDKVITKSHSKRISALMQTCGFYDEAGEFAFRVGLPGKSGVGGGIAAILPEHYSLAVWSPRLNPNGNSLMGMKALELFTTKTGTSIF